MLPNDYEILLNAKEMPRNTKTFNINFESKRIAGTAGEREALKQWIWAALNTPRYRYPIFSRNFGLETDNLIGMPFDYVCAELAARITDALSIDERITDVGSFEFEKKDGAAEVKFTVKTIYGDIDEGTAVRYV